MGGRWSLGVFVWGTLSVMDLMVGRAVNDPIRGSGLEVGLEVVNGTVIGTNGTGMGFS